MALLRFIVWTACAMGLGVLAATVPVGGKTPWDRARSQLSSSLTPASLSDLKHELAFALERAADPVAKNPKPREVHSANDKAALRKLIAKKSQP